MITIVASLLLGCIDSLLPSLAYMINNSLQSATSLNSILLRGEKIWNRNTFLIPTNLKTTSCLESPLSLQASETSYFTTSRTCEHEEPHTHFSVRLPFRPQHGGSASPCVSWPSPIRWHWQCFCSDVIRPLSCIWRNRPPHYSGSCPKLLWNFWSCYRLVSVMPFRPSAKLIISVDDVSSDQAVLQFRISQFSPGAHFVRFLCWTTYSNIWTYLGPSVEKNKEINNYNNRKASN